MGYKYVGVDGEALNGWPATDLSDADVVQIAGERQMTVQAAVALLDACRAYGRVGAPLEVESEAPATRKASGK